MDTTVQTMVYFTPLDEMTVTVLAIVYFVYYIDAPRIIVGSDDWVQVKVHAQSGSHLVYSVLNLLQLILFCDL